MSDKQLLEQYEQGLFGRLDDEQLVGGALGSATQLDSFAEGSDRDDEEDHQLGKIKQWAQGKNLSSLEDQQPAMIEEQCNRRFQLKVDNIEDLLQEARNFHVSETDSKAFEDLCKDSYECAMNEEGLDYHEKDAVLRKAAETGEFDIQGGVVGNAWARLAKSDKFKLECTQAD